MLYHVKRSRHFVDTQTEWGLVNKAASFQRLSKDLSFIIRIPTQNVYHVTLSSKHVRNPRRWISRNFGLTSGQCFLRIKLYSTLTQHKKSVLDFVGCPCQTVSTFFDRLTGVLIYLLIVHFIGSAVKSGTSDSWFRELVRTVLFKVLYSHCLAKWW